MILQNSGKQLVVNADDFGFTRDVNQGIVEAHQRGILTATTLMANGQAFDDAVRLARENPSLDIGAHLVLVGGPALSTPGRDLPAGIPRLLAAIAARRIRIYDELSAQVRRILDAGIRLTHLDTHKHTHLAPPVLDAVARIAEETGTPWVRRGPSSHNLLDSVIPSVYRRAHTKLLVRGLTMAKALLFCLLILLTPADDAWARATPGPENDVRAAENNDFLIRADAEAAFPPAAALAPGRFGGARLREGGLVTAAPAAAPRLATRFGPDPLYVLMSLQR